VAGVPSRWGSRSTHSSTYHRVKIPWEQGTGASGIRPAAPDWSRRSSRPPTGAKVDLLARYVDAIEEVIRVCADPSHGRWATRVCFSRSTSDVSRFFC